MNTIWHHHHYLRETQYNIQHLIKRCPRSIKHSWQFETVRHIARHFKFIHLVDIIRREDVFNIGAIVILIFIFYLKEDDVAMTRYDVWVTQDGMSRFNLSWSITRCSSVILISMRDMPSRLCYSSTAIRHNCIFFIYLFLYSACLFLPQLGISLVYWLNLFKTHCVLFASRCMAKL